MDFEQRLEKAIERGQRSGDVESQRLAEQLESEEEVKRLHSQFRRELVEHIEECVGKLPDHFPGFRYDTILDERGWGAAVSRDDVGILSGGGRGSFFSRLELVVRPYSSSRVLELAAKGTIRNKEVYNRNHFQRLNQADTNTFASIIDLWVLEYAERYAAKD